ncbi:mitochondrial import inner membrane translocase subunit Tim21 [Octopus sinensis]|uniref:Mitochondrial import inner membrane translocase subunit Tim21 n=1 Tax=Octopus sinensis TaxID=2607531 RepID=A0A6P7TN21_9MOLL|nr:mitochondrial import inner membrane translocase subunit Tim21 [Octopus sinensis]
MIRIGYLFQMPHCNRPTSLLLLLLNRSNFKPTLTHSNCLLAVPNLKPVFPLIRTSRLHSACFSLNKDSRILTTAASKCTNVNIRFASEKKQTDSEDPGEKKELMEAWKSPYEGLNLGEKVKEASKDVTYTGVIIVGVGITAIMFYAIAKELLSKESPNAVFGEAFKRCKNDPEVQQLLGEPIKAYGEESGRRRRRHVSHAEFKVGDVKHLRLRFYIEGPYRKATVNLEKKQNENGKYEYRYLFVQCDTYPNQVVILEDNR